MLTDDELLKIQQLREENAEFNGIIERLNEESKFMLSRLSHEIRNPLTLISSTLQLMETKNPEVSDLKYWSQVRSDVNDLMGLLNDLSSYNNCDKLELSTVDLSLMLSNLVASFQSQYVESHFNITLAIHKSALAVMSAYVCDDIKMKQVFTNIMKNGLEAMKAHNSLSITAKIDDLSERNLYENKYSITNTTDPSYLLLSFRNNGSPIPEDFLDRIFDPFITNKPNGSGIGLAISAKIIDAHHGFISVSSTKESTTFEIRLPICDSLNVSNGE